MLLSLEQELMTIDQSALDPEEWLYPPTARLLFTADYPLALRHPYGNNQYAQAMRALWTSPAALAWSQVHR